MTSPLVASWSTKGRYDAGALDAMENAAKVSRALWILSGVALAVAGLFIAGVLAIKSFRCVALRTRLNESGSVVTSTRGSRAASRIWAATEIASHNVVWIRPGNCEPEFEGRMKSRPCPQLL